MAYSSKPIIAIIGSRSINNINLGLFTDPSHCGQIISGDANGVDTIAKNWAAANKIEYVEYKSNYKIYGNRAPLVRDEEMVNAADIIIAFWNGKSTGTLYTLRYAIKTNRPYICHLIIDLD